MASTSAAIAMDSSTVAGRPRWSYDAFLSFRGEDTRNNFIGHVLASLSRKGIHTFFDDKELERGEQIKPALLKAIEESQIAVVVFSENYASSTWCLEELSKIIECIESGGGQKLIPVFYRVEPSVVRKQPSGSAFHTALEKHKERNPDKVQKWREALQKASDISGEHFDNGVEADFVEKIARLVSERIGRRQLMDVAKNPVGLDSEIEKVKPLLRIEELEKVYFIGIVGTGGMGKTTLAKALYNLFAEEYEGCSFLENVRETATKQHDGLVKLQKQLLSDFMRGEEIHVSNVSSGISSIKHRLRNKRCLIVLDDVDHHRQMDALAGGCDWFGPGSRIIVTTRDEHVLAQVRAIKHRMDCLSEDCARELLSWSAFGEPYPATEYEKVCSDVLNYAKGLPLALKVLGSSLYEADVSHWEDTIQKLKDVPDEEICKILQISYDGLPKDVKAIFLHIACFFKGETKDKVVKILNGCGYYSDIGIRVLTQRSLITIIQREFYGQVLDMHDLIEEMGKNIVKQESEEPTKRSRLWLREDVRSLLEDNTETAAIQAICLNDYLDFEYWKMHFIRLNPKAFEKTPRLQMLILSDSVFWGGPSSLPNELRWLEWRYYPSLSLPPDFNPSNLAGLILYGGKIRELWDERKMGPKLTVISLTECLSLLKFPDVSGMPNLKELSADWCKSLVRVHESVGSLDKLEVLTFSGCESLKEFPSKLRLPSLKYLSLRGCNKLEKFPDILGMIEHLQTLDVGGTSIKELPPSIENLIGELQTLNLSFSEGLEALPRCIYHLPNLEFLDVSACPSLRGFMEKGEEIEEGNDEVDSTSATTPSYSSFKRRNSSSLVIPNLVELNLRYSEITSLSTCISKCYSLKKLDLRYSKRLKEIPELPPKLEFLDAGNCYSLETVGTQSLRAMGKIRMDFTDTLSAYLLRGNEEECGSEILSEWLKGHEERRRGRTSFPEVEVDLNDYHFEVIIPGGDIPDRFYHGRTSSSIIGWKSRVRFRVYSQSKVLEELAGFAIFAAFPGESHTFRTCKWSMNINGVPVYAQKEMFVMYGGHVCITYIHLKKHWKEVMMKPSVDGWNHLSFEAVCRDNLSSSRAEQIKNIGVAFIGLSGEDLPNPSTEIEFLGPEVAMADKLEVQGPMMQTEEVIIEDEDIASVLSITSEISNIDLAAAGSTSSMAQPLLLQKPTLLKRKRELFPNQMC